MTRHLPDWLSRALAPHQPRLLRIMLLTCGMNLLMLAGPWLAGQMSDLLLATGLTRATGLLLLGLGAIVLLRAALNYHARVILGHAAEALAADLRQLTFVHVQSLPWACHQEQRAGDLLTAVAEDSQTLAGFITGSAVSILPTLLLFAGTLVAVCLIEPRALLVAVVVAPLYLVLVRWLTSGLPALTATLRQRSADNQGLLVGLLQTNALIRSFGRQQWAAAALLESNQAQLVAFDAANRRHSLVGPLSQAAAALAVIGLVWVGGDLFTAGQAGDFVALALYLLLMIRPLNLLAETLTEGLAVLGAVQRLREIMALLPEDGGGELTVGSVDELAIAELSARYPERETLFGGVSLTLRPGDVVAITGANGAGKTTLLNLLVRFMAPASGSLTLNGQVYPDYELASLRACFAYLQQDTQLMAGTLLDNVRFTAPDADREKVRGALKVAQADFVERLPDGLDTWLGEDGEMLSGGERQRIALARMILSDRPILLLDEPTSMFDLASERRFVQAFGDWLGERIVVIVTHRPLMLALASRRFELTASGLVAMEDTQDQPAMSRY